jgi:hypothetical protein
MSQMGRSVSIAVGLFVVFLTTTWPALQAQRKDLSAGGDWTFDLANVLPKGQPVIPIFESWWVNADGTSSLSFGYINLNSAEEFHIPIGPDNTIEPKEFNGMQPTHFDPAPKDPDRFARHQSVFSVTLPKGYKGDVVWTLRVKGKTYSSPGRTKSAEYDIDVLNELTESPVAPLFRFGDGPAGRGRSAFVAGPVAASVGKPLPLTVGVDLLSRSLSTVTFYHHQGPGKVSLDPREIVIKASGNVTTNATFSEPGEYMLRVTGLESTAALEQHCCYTNGYIKVTVSR